MGRKLDKNLDNDLYKMANIVSLSDGGMRKNRGAMLGAVGAMLQYKHGDADAHRHAISK